MKKTLTILLFVPFLMQAQQDTGYTIQGKITGYNESGSIYLNHPSPSGRSIWDTAEIKKGSFVFKGKITNPQHAVLMLDHTGKGLADINEQSDIKQIYLERGTITFTTEDSVKNGTTKGSLLNKEFEQYTKLLKAANSTIQTINEEYISASEEKKQDAVFRESFNAKFQTAAAEKRAIQQQFIRQNPGSYVSLQALKELAGAEKDIALLTNLYNTLSPSLQQSKEAITLKRRLNKAHTTEIGAIAPDFTQKTTNKKPVSLSDFRGKYVFIDFWASWCKPCLKESPGIIKAYSAYKDKNFAVLGVSLDKDEASWRYAIKNNGLEWTQISDLKGWQNEVVSLYGINIIPQNILIDPSGKIIAKNLSGNALMSELARLLRK